MASTFMTSIGSLFSPVTDVYSTLEVTEGFHQGVAVPLEQAVCRIGAAEQADVMLSDVGVAAEHVILRFHARMVAIEAVGGEVTVGGETLAQGTGWRTDLPVTIDVGGARLRLSRPDISLPPLLRLAHETVEPAWRTARESLPGIRRSLRATLRPLVSPLRRFLAVIAEVIGTGLARMPIPAALRERGRRLLARRRRSGGERVGRGAVVTALCTTIGVVGAYQLVGVDEAGADISAEALNSTAALYPQVAEAALTLTAKSATPTEALGRRLERAGLDGLQVRDAGNHLEVSGQFAPERHEDWQGVQRWFDQRYGSSQVLVSNAKPSLVPDRPAFRFQAVWLGDNPYVIGTKGERLYPGASLPEGWVLAAIGDERVTLRRGDEELSLTL
ncbi:FHA domain-containing protein [Halomonas elongata]|uniref:SctD/MshK family protein n=1 Tax=Halomonas elongata TaxID=2746 RepID=UPI0038D4F239